MSRFGLAAEKPRIDYLNYTGVILSFLSAGFFIMVKPETSPLANTVQPVVSDDPEKLPVEEAKSSKQADKSSIQDSRDLLDRLSPVKKKVIGISMAVVAGLFYGESFTPMIYAAERDGHRPYVEYLFSYYTGILLTSATYFAVYCVVRKNKPVMNNRLVLPAWACGVLWAAGNVCQTIGTSKLSQAVSFPIANSGPAIVSTLWAVFLFKEIKGKRNFMLLSAGFVMAISASILSAFSF